MLKTVIRPIQNIQKSMPKYMFLSIFLHKYHLVCGIARCVCIAQGYNESKDKLV